jgi:acetoacetyl-CoA synthetase
MTALGSVPPVLWVPPRDQDSVLSRFMEFLANRGHVFRDYESLREWSVDELAEFWSSVWLYFDLPTYSRPTQVLASEQMPGFQWFPDLTTNYADAALRLEHRKDDDVVVVSRSQTRDEVHLTASELREMVGRVYRSLASAGVGQGDCVAAYAPNIWETLVLFLASASLGAVFCSCAPEFGVTSVIDRLEQVEPVVLFAVDGYVFGEKRVDRREAAITVWQSLPSVTAFIWLSYLEPTAPPPAGAVTFDEFMAEETEYAYEPVSFDHPLYVLFSSGTTGKPKAIIHGHGGMVLAHSASQGLQYDIGPADIFYWFTTTGWMMWNYLVSGLLRSATIVLFDGDPQYPDIEETWRVVDDLSVTQLGTSAGYLSACQKAGLKPKDRHRLSTLRGVGSTGSPLPAASYRWFYEAFDTDVMLTSQSGGTDVCGGFVGGSPLSPVYEGEIACRLLGVAVESFSDEGRSLVEQQGELVITRPMPSMPVGLVNDPDGSAYRAAYFDRFPGVWRHGDWLTITDRGTCVISGRSDATLNRGGVRLGTAEFYSSIESLREIHDSLVVHVEDDSGGPGTLWLFVQLVPSALLDEAFEKRIAATLRNDLSPRHVPDRIVAVRAIPRTLSGKKMEVPVKRLLIGAAAADVAAKDSMADPSAMDAYEEIARRERSKRMVDVEQ